MKFKKALLALATLGLVVCTTSCGGPAKTFRPGFNEWGSNYAKLREGQGYHDPFSKVKGKDKDGRSKSGYKVTDVKTLVVPVDFTNHPADDPDTAANEEEAFVSTIEKAVFGKAEDTRWHSLASYYEATSWGQCKVAGEVVPTFHLGVTDTELEQGASFGKEYKTGGFTGAPNEEASKCIANAVRDIYAPGGARYGQLDLKDFDANGDNYIDAVILIYNRPMRHNSNPGTPNLYWAFRWSCNGFPTTAAPAADTFFWCSYETLFDAGLDKGIDCHTLIHEFGHILSLPDFYNYDYNGKDASAHLDMMDHNIGDHNSLSKSWLGWTTPFVLESKGTVTIRSTTDTGEYILIPVKGKWSSYHDQSKQKFDGTLLSQFLMIEFITPTGVAESDGKAAYREGWDKYFSKAGVRIWHVDARIGQYLYNSSSGTWSFSGYTVATAYNGPGSGSNQLATSNTSSEMVFPNNPLLLMLRPGVKGGDSTWWHGRSGATDNDLFQVGDSLKGYKFFNDTGKLTVPVGYNISVVNIDGNNSATIRFS